MSTNASLQRYEDPLSTHLNDTKVVCTVMMLRQTLSNLENVNYILLYY